MRKIALLLVAAAFSAPALADPPTVVGRLSLIEGAASIRHSYDQQWAAGGINYPVIAGDAVWADQGSRAEVQFGAAEARLDQASELDIDRLDDGGAALRVPQGVVNLTVRYVPPGGIQLLTSVGQLAILRPGEYHIDSGRQGGPPTQLLLGVLTGEATFSGMRGVVDLRSGQGAMVPPDQSVMTVVAIYPTPFDQWAENRAGQLMATQSEAYISPEMTGYQDLGAYGEWQPVPDYGMAWFPTQVEIGWAPYRHGHWDYVRPWGWTWIDEAPWGFAPFHYGRWAEFDGRWGWIPGERRERPYYAPALVAFVGGMPGERMGAGIGWVPLGPREVFHPYYDHSDHYLLVINRAHFHDEHEFREREAQWHGPDARMDNFANHRAVTNVSAGTFSGGQPVHQNMTPQTSSGGGHGGPAPVMSDFNHLPQPQPRPAQPAPVAAPQGQFVGPQPRPEQQHPTPQPGQPQQLRPQVPTAPAPQQPAAAPQPHPAAAPQPIPQAQPQGQPMHQPEFHPQPQPQPQQVQQPRPQPQQQQPAPQKKDDKDPKRDRR